MNTFNYFFLLTLFVEVQFWLSPKLPFNFAQPRRVPCCVYTDFSAIQDKVQFECMKINSNYLRLKCIQIDECHLRAARDSFNSSRSLSVKRDFIKSSFKKFFSYRSVSRFNSESKVISSFKQYWLFSKGQLSCELPKSESSSHLPA